MCVRAATVFASKRCVCELLMCVMMQGSSPPRRPSASARCSRQWQHCSYFCHLSPFLPPRAAVAAAEPPFLPRNFHFCRMLFCRFGLPPHGAERGWAAAARRRQVRRLLAARTFGEGTCLSRVVYHVSAVTCRVYCPSVTCMSRFARAVLRTGRLQGTRKGKHIRHSRHSLSHSLSLPFSLSTTTTTHTLNLGAKSTRAAAGFRRWPE